MTDSVHEMVSGYEIKFFEAGKLRTFYSYRIEYLVEKLKSELV